MRLLLDEQLSPAIAQQLKLCGHDVLAVAEPGLRGHDDAAVLTWASSQARAVVTNNIRDFRPLHANYLSAATGHYGIILVPSTKYSLRLDALEMIVTALDRLLTEHPQPEEWLGREIFL
jgi:hypothetical protein